MSGAPGGRQCQGDPTIDTCTASHCCEQFLRCADDSQCLDCYRNGGESCQDNKTFQPLAVCRSQGCNQSADSGPTWVDGGDARSDAGEPPEDATPLFREVLTVAVIHASANLWPFRVCFELPDQNRFADTEPLPSDPGAVMPHSNMIGVAPGSALVVREAEVLFGDGDVNVRPHLIRADRLVGKQGKTCAELLCSDAWCLKPGDSVSPSTLQIDGLGSEGASVLAVHGCLAGEGVVTPERCGGDVQGSGKLAIEVFPTYEVRSYDPDPGLIRVRIAHLSESVDKVLLGDAGAAQKLQLRYGALDQPSNGLLLLDGAKFPTIQPDQGQVELTVPGVATADLPEYAARGITLHATVPDGGATLALSLSLAEVQDLSNTQALPHKFWNGASDFLVVLLGDATQDAEQLQKPGGGSNPFFDGYGLHVIAVPLRMRTVDVGQSSP